MKIIQALLSSCIFSLALVGLALIANGQAKIAAPRVFLLDGPKLAETKRRVHSRDPTFAASLVKLETDARRALDQQPSSVVTKTATPPSAYMIGGNSLCVLCVLNVPVVDLLITCCSH